MPDQTIALQLNIDTNAPDAIDQLNQKIAELQQQVDSAAKGSQQFSDAFANLDSAKALLDQMSASAATLSPQMDGLAKGTQDYNAALADVGKNASGIADVGKAVNSLDPDTKAAQFQKFGDTAASFNGIAAAAQLAAQGNTDLSAIVEKATASASLAGAQQLATAQNIHAQELQENDSFGKSISDTNAKYQAFDLSNAQTTANEKKRILDSEFSAAQSGANALTELANSMVAQGQKNTDAQKATALIKIGIDTAKAISSLVAASNENPANAATSGVAGAVQFAAGLAEILANIAQAKNILAGGDTGGSSGSGSGASPSISSATSSINTSAPNLSQQQPSPGSTSLSASTQGNTYQTGTIKAYVVESEITQAQQRATTLKNQSMH